jgi:hypothetical protein
MLIEVILVIWLCPFCRVSADALEADLGSQSADTIKLNFIRCGRRASPAGWLAASGTISFAFD